MVTFIAIFLFFFFLVLILLFKKSIMFRYNLHGVSQMAQWQIICLPMQEMQETGVQSLCWEDPLE